MANESSASEHSDDDSAVVFYSMNDLFNTEGPRGPYILERTLYLGGRERHLNANRFVIGYPHRDIRPSIFPRTPAQKYDPNLTSAHKYLGTRLRERTGRTIFEEGVIHTIPVIFLKLNLIPGQILPIIARSSAVQSILKYALSSNRSFGVSYKLNKNSRTFGTIAEVYEHSVNIENVILFQVKAMGHQRYEILNLSKFLTSPEKYIALAQIKILPDITLPHPYNKLCLHPRKRNSNHNKMCYKRDMWQTQWPDWVYKQFDVHQLASRLTEIVKTLYKDLKTADDPKFLSFQLTRLGILDPEQVSFLLGVESTNLRLQYELQFLKQNQYMENFICVSNGCRSDICKLSSVFPMSPEGPQGIYCDSLGVIHDIITVHTLEYVLNPAIIGRPSTECCWFPGYNWVIILCPNCRIELGWRFIANDDSLIPRLFYGLSTRFITSIRNYRSPSQNRENLDEAIVNDGL